MVELCPIDAANLLAGQAVAYAAAFLDGRHDAATLARNAGELKIAIEAQSDPATRRILDPVKILMTAMFGAADACRYGAVIATHARQDRWCAIMRELVELVRGESRALIGDGQ